MSITCRCFFAVSRKPNPTCAVICSATSLRRFATITSIAPATGTTEGGTAVTINGDNFGPASVAVGSLLMGDMLFTSVVHVDGNTITAVTPALVGTNNGQNLPVSLTIGEQLGTSTYTYVAPTITSIDLVAQTVPDQADGVRMTIYGTQFADVTPITAKIPASTDRIKIKATKGATTVDCLNIARISYEKLQCDYPNGGRGASGYNVQVEIAEQESCFSCGIKVEATF